MKIKQLSLTLLICAISGCALYGPTYTKPNIDTSSQWSSTDSLSKVESGANLSDTAWWQRFDDKELNSLIKEALESNNNIQMSIGSVVQAQGYLQQIQMGWVPTVGGQVAYSNTQVVGAANAASNASSVGASSSSTGYGAGFVPSYSLNILQQLRYQEAAKASLMAAQYTKDAMRLTIISQVASGYFTLIGQDYQLELQKQLVEDLGKQLQLGQDQYKLGYISLLTLQNYEQQYYTAKAQLPIIQNNIVQSQNALRVLIDKNPGNIKRGISFINIKIDGVIPAGLPSDVLKHRPDIMQAEQQLIEANANIGVANSNFFPTVSLTGALGSSATDLSGLFTPGTDFWQQQIQATMPFLNLSYLGTIKGAKGAYYNSYYNYINTVRTAFQQVDNALSGHQQLTNSYNIQKSQLDSAQLGYKIGDERYKQGADSYATMLNYKITMDNASITLSSIKLQQLQSIVTLYQSLAGGYNVKNTDAPKKFGDSHDA